MGRNITWEETPKVTYEVVVQGATLEARFSQESQETRISLLVRKPSDALEGALTIFHETYFPHVLPKHLGLAWHKDCAGSRLNIRRKKLISRTWPLSWYWKVMFHELTKWKEEDAEQWYLRISQVRDWVLAYLYKESGEKAELLRPPLFGPSERLLLFDSYMTLLDFQGDIEDEWKVYERASGRAGRRAKASVLGRNDFTYRIDKVQRLDGKVEVTLRVHLNLHPFILSDASRLEKISCLSKEVLPEVIQYPDDMTWVPRFSNPSGKEKEFALLLRSLPVCHAIEKLSEIWNDQTVKSVVIIAPPGSGKEVIARSIYDCRQYKGEYCTFQMSATRMEANQRNLYFRDTSKYFVRKDILNMISENSEEPKIDERDGLVFKARRGVLFLDEIDKVNDSSRAELLRLLENDEVVLYGEPVVLGLGKSVPVYLFAGSMPRRDMFRLAPPDFWTRITHVVDMVHPLSSVDPKEIADVAADYFHMFWIDHLFKVWSESGILPDKPPDGEVASPAYEIVRERSKTLLGALLNIDVVRFFAERFAEELCAGRDDVSFSIRKIRSVAQRTIYAVVEYLLWDHLHSNGISQLEEFLVREVKNDCDLLDILLSVVDKRELGPRLVGKKKSKKKIQEMCRKLIEAVRHDLRGAVAHSLRLVPE